jgi:hypothetical protein
MYTFPVHAPRLDGSHINALSFCDICQQHWRGWCGHLSNNDDAANVNKYAFQGKDSAREIQSKKKFWISTFKLDLMLPSQQLLALAINPSIPRSHSFWLQRYSIGDEPDLSYVKHKSNM